jgi:hypothetical protein
MNPDFANPSSIPSIKRLARAIQASDRCKYAQALEIAAQTAGHSTFHAAMSAAQTAPPLPRHSISIINRWRDTRAQEMGTVELEMTISQPLTSLVKPHQMVGRLGGYQLMGDKTLVGKDVIHAAESTAKWFSAKAGRAVQFMDATGLKPSKKYRFVWPDDDTNNRIPGADHYVVWYDPERKKYVITDEPYHGSIRRNDHERTAWCRKHGYDLQPVDWAGMHNPSPDNIGGTVLYLIAKETDNIPLQQLAEKANALCKPMRRRSEDHK